MGLTMTQAVSDTFCEAFGTQCSSPFCQYAVYGMIFLIVMIPFDRIGIPLLAWRGDNTLPLLWLRTVLETAMFCHPIVVWIAEVDTALWDWSAGAMMLWSVLSFHCHCWQPFFGFLGGFYSKPLDTSLARIPLRTAALKSVATKFGLERPFGKQLYRPAIFIEGATEEPAQEPAVTSVVFEPAGRSFPDCFHIRLPECEGAPALDCAGAKYHHGVECNFFYSLHSAHQKFKINLNGTISPYRNPAVALGTQDGTGQLRLVGVESAEALCFSLEVQDGVVVDTLQTDDIEAALKLQQHSKA